MKVKIEVEVEISGKPSARAPEDFSFMGVKVVGDDFQQCPLPKDAPCPRRFVSDLVKAASAKLTASTSPTEE